MGLLDALSRPTSTTPAASVDGRSPCPRCDSLHVWTDRQSRIRCHACDPPRHASLVAHRQIVTIDGPEPWPRQEPQGAPGREICRWGDMRDGESIEAWWNRLDGGHFGLARDLTLSRESFRIREFRGR